MRLRRFRVRDTPWCRSAIRLLSTIAVAPRRSARRWRMPSSAPPALPRAAARQRTRQAEDRTPSQTARRQSGRATAASPHGTGQVRVPPRNTLRQGLRGRRGPSSGQPPAGQSSKNSSVEVKHWNLRTRDSNCFVRRTVPPEAQIGALQRNIQTFLSRRKQRRGTTMARREIWSHR